MRRLVASTIAQRLGVGSSADPLPALMAILASQHGLLVLDNFEQVVEAAPVIAQVLAGAPHLTVLVTSREPLRIGGEHEYPLAPLSVRAGRRTHWTLPNWTQSGCLPSGRRPSCPASP